MHAKYEPDRGPYPAAPFDRLPVSKGIVLSMLLLDLSPTSHPCARTGIPWVTRSLHAAPGDRAIAISHDPHLDAGRPLESWARAHLTAKAASERRGAQWPLSAKLRDRRQRGFGRGASPLPEDI